MTDIGCSVGELKENRKSEELEEISFTLGLKALRTALTICHLITHP